MPLKHKHSDISIHTTHTHLACRFSISRSLSRCSLLIMSLCRRASVCRFSSARSSCSLSCSSSAFARCTSVRFSCRRRACCSSLATESFSSSHTRRSSSSTCSTHRTKDQKLYREPGQGLDNCCKKITLLLRYSFLILAHNTNM